MKYIVPTLKVLGSALNVIQSQSNKTSNSGDGPSTGPAGAAYDLDE